MTARVIATVLLLGVLGGCGAASGVVDQARDIQEQAGEVIGQAREIQEQIDGIRWCTDVLRLATAVETTNVEASRNLVDALVRSGPEALAADVAVVDATVRDIEAGRAGADALGNDDVASAVERLTGAVEQGCADGAVQFGSD